MSQLPSDFRNRLTRWYATAGWLSKMTDIDEMISTWKGAHDQLLQRMESAYGPEPPPPSMTYKERGERIMRDHEPSMLQYLQKQLNDNRGKEEEWLIHLKIRFGEDPSYLPTDGESNLDSPQNVTSTGLKRWRRGDEVMSRYPPVTGKERHGIVLSCRNGECDVHWSDNTKTHSISSLLLEPSTGPPAIPQPVPSKQLLELEAREARLAQRESDLLEWAHHWGVSDQSEQSDIGSSTAPTRTKKVENSSAKRREYRERLERFYRKYNPLQMVIIDQMLNAAEGNEEKMFAALVKVHGPEPPAIAGRIGVVGEDKPKFIDRLKVFYSHYRPKHNKDLNKIASNFIGREEELIAALVAKYGPEPVQPPPPPPPNSRPMQRMNVAVANSMKYLESQNRKLRQGHQRQLLRVLRGNAEQGIYAAYYFRWMEFMWLSKNRKLLTRVTDESNCSLLKEKFIHQQLVGQVALLKNELATQEATNGSTSLPSGDLSPDVDIYQVKRNLSPHDYSVGSLTSKALSTDEWAKI